MQGSILQMPCFLLLTIPSVAWSDHRAAPGPYAVTTVLGEWKDGARRGRVVLWKCYLPSATRSAAPVVIYSPGGGGSRESNEMLGRHLASHGLAALHVQHEGSDDKAVRGNPRALRAVNDPNASADRFRDIAFVVNKLKSNEGLGELAGRLNAARIGISGHSYGGLTCQIIAGQLVTGYGQSLALPELRGAFILSPSPPRGLYGDATTSFHKMLMPMFSVTGTADAPPDRSFTPADRLVPFERTTSVEQWSLVLNGASHFTTSGQKTRPRVARFIPGMDDDPNLEKNHAVIRAAALAFWQATMLDDNDARSYLNDGAFAAFVGQRGVVKHKPAGN